MSNLADSILSREEYIAAFKSQDSQDFSNYREHILSELVRLFRHRLFPAQLEMLRETFETSLQELVDATPEDTEILEREHFEDQVLLTLEEQREYNMRAHFEMTFQRLKDDIRAIVNSTIFVSARI